MTDWVSLIQAERQRQDHKWGEQNHSDMKWLAILMEEVGELAKAILENDDNGVDELVQVAAVSVAWLEAVSRRQEQADDR